MIIFTAAGVATSLTREHDSAAYHNTLTCDPCTKSTKRRTTRTERGARVCPRPSGATIQAKLGTRACQIGASGTLGSRLPTTQKRVCVRRGRRHCASRTSNRSASDDLSTTVQPERESERASFGFNVKFFAFRTENEDASCRASQREPGLSFSLVETTNIMGRHVGQSQPTYDM